MISKTYGQADSASEETGWKASHRSGHGRACALSAPRAGSPGRLDQTRRRSLEPTAGSPPACDGGAKGRGSLRARQFERSQVSLTERLSPLKTGANCLVPLRLTPCSSLNKLHLTQQKDHCYLTLDGSCGVIGERTGRI